MSLRFRNSSCTWLHPNPCLGETAFHLLPQLMIVYVPDANKSSPDSGHPDDLLPPTADKAFYENLPFHGLKKPPPQVGNIVFANTALIFSSTH